MLIHRLTALAIVTVSATVMRMELVPAIDRIVVPPSLDPSVQVASAPNTPQKRGRIAEQTGRQPQPQPDQTGQVRDH